MGSERAERSTGKKKGKGVKRKQKLDRQGWEAVRDERGEGYFQLLRPVGAKLSAAPKSCLPCMDATDRPRPSTAMSGAPWLP